ncbi:MAG: VacJ family lipoprotein, partial [Comamonadaceae bacterium]|nr:VacJ family lipoprotein [Comamonadaceae bacterium]
EDFGQTLATWGWRDSRYLVLPLLGPRTVRDAIGIVGDYPLSPVGYVQDSGTASGLQVLEIVDMRTRMLPIDEFRRDAIDDYLFVRDAWAQRRNHQIQQDLRSSRD